MNLQWSISIPFILLNPSCSKYINAQKINIIEKSDLSQKLYLLGLSQKKIYQGKLLTDLEKNYKHSDPLIIGIDNVNVKYITKFKA